MIVDADVDMSVDANIPDLAPEEIPCSPECAGTLPFCLAGNCVECAANADCSGSTPFCSPAGTCVDCQGEDGTEIPGPYYEQTEGLSEFALKTALYNIIRNHRNRGYDALWEFYDENDRDAFYEDDSTLLDVYSENPLGEDPNSLEITTDRCGNYTAEGDCYNREHVFPQSWFEGNTSLLRSDAHQVIPVDGYLNGRRDSYPHGPVGRVTYVSAGGAKLGRAADDTGFRGTVFEPVDEFKGDLARIYFYIATRYESSVGRFAVNRFADGVLDGSNGQVFQDWYIDVLLNWHRTDPVSLREIERNEAVYLFQDNRNPFIDCPQYAEQVWGSL